MEVQLNSAEDGRSESRDGAGGQSSERGQAAGGSGHCDLRRCRGSGASDAHAALATKPRSGGTRGSGENDRCAYEREGNAAGAAASANPNNTDDADGHAGNGAFPREEAVLREAMRQAENTAVGQSPHGSRASGGTQASHSGRAAGRTGERPWREVDGDRRRAPEQIRPSCQRQICLLLKTGESAAGWRSPSSSARRTPMAEADPRKVDGQKSTMENQTRMQNWRGEEAWTARYVERNARHRLGKASAPFVKHNRRALTPDTRKEYSSAKSALDNGAPVKGDAAREMEGSAGASAPTEDAQLVRTDVNEAGDATDALSRS